MRTVTFWADSGLPATWYLANDVRMDVYSLLLVSAIVRVARAAGMTFQDVQERLMENNP